MNAQPKREINWTALSTIVAIIALIISLVTYSIESMKAREASRAEKLASDLRMLIDVRKNVNLSVAQFSKNYGEELEAYASGKSKVLSDDALNGLDEMLTEIEYLLWLLDKNYISVDGVKQAWIDRLAWPILHGYFAYIQKFGKDGADKRMESFFPTIKVVAAGYELQDLYPEIRQRRK